MNRSLIVARVLTLFLLIAGVLHAQDSPAANATTHESRAGKPCMAATH